jgi:hypothetical protein
MEFGALLIAAIGLVTAILDERRRTAPARDRRALEADYDADMQRANQALPRGDAAALTQLFDQERQAAIRRGDLDPRGARRADGSDVVFGDHPLAGRPEQRPHD